MSPTRSHVAPGIPSPRRGLGQPVAHPHALTQMVLHLGPDAVIRAATSSAVQLLGRDPASIVGQPLPNLLAPADRPRLAQVFTDSRAERSITCRLDAGEAVVWVTLRVAAAVGSERLAWVHPLPPPRRGGLLDPQDDPDSAQMFRLAFDDAAIPMAVTDLDGAFRRVNTAFLELLGYTEGELLTFTPADLAHPADVAIITDGYTRLLRGDVDRLHLECRYLHRSGRPLHVELASSLLRGRGEAPAGFLHQAVDVTERARLASELEHRASHDPLTDLPNRNLLQESLRSALATSRRYGGHVCVVFLDLNGFKQVNDTIGHAAGDALLIEVGRRLRAVVREGDVVGRIGGDEFVVVAHSEEPEHITALVTRLEDVFTRPVTVSDQVVQVRASIGVAVSDGSTDAETLLSNADQNMYDAKWGAAGDTRRPDGDPEASA